MKRHPFTDDNQFTSNQWIKVFAVFWLCYLTFNTKNPVSQMLTVSKSTFSSNDTFFVNALVLMLGVIYCAVVFSGSIWGIGLKKVRELFVGFRVRHIFTIIGTFFLSYFFLLIGSLLSTVVPMTSTIETSNTIEIAQIESWKAFWLLSVGKFFTTIAMQLVAVLLFSLLLTTGMKYLAKHQRIVVCGTYVISSAVIGALATTATNPGVFTNMAVYGMMQIPLFWSYRRSNTLVVPILASFAVDRVAILLMILLSL